MPETGLCACPSVHKLQTNVVETAERIVTYLLQW